MTTIVTPTSKHRSAKLLLSMSLLLVASLLPCPMAEAQDYLSGSEVAIIGTGSVGLGLIGRRLSKVKPERSTICPRPLLFDLSFQRLIGGSYEPDKSNFLDSKFGSVITPVLFGGALLFSDLKWPTGDKDKNAAQDMYLFHIGLVANKGITDMFKGIVARPRPFVYCDTIPGSEKQSVDYAWSRQSFYSGHTSSSFYAATYVNKRLRSIMRLRMSSSGYRNWRWAPPLVLYGWSAFVGLSRVHAFKHYMTDIVAGALAGWLVGELVYSLGSTYAVKARGNSDYTPVLKIAFSL